MSKDSVRLCLDVARFKIEDNSLAVEAFIKRYNKKLKSRTSVLQKIGLYIRELLGEMKDDAEEEDGL